MKYEITQEQLQIVLNLISGIENTTLVSPKKYRDEVSPFLGTLVNLPVIEESAKIECDENEIEENPVEEVEQGV